MLRVVVVMLFVVWATVARAQPWLDQLGVAGSTIVAMNDAHVRLPPGAWRQVSEADSRRLFVQSDGKQVVALAYVYAHGPGVWRKQHVGFRPDSSCYQADVFLNDSRDLYPGQWDCMVVTHSMVQWQSLPMWRRGIDAVRDLGGMPRPLIKVQLSRASPSRTMFVTLQVFVNPAVSGFASNPAAAWANSEWHKDNATPDRIAFLNKVAAWGEAYRPILGKSWD